MKRLKPKTNHILLIIFKKVGQTTLSSMRFYVNPWEKHEIDKVLFLIRTHNPDMYWRYEKLPK